MIICEYGCGQEAEYQLKNGKWCCSSHSSKCPFLKNKISLKVKTIWDDNNSIYHMGENITCNSLQFNTTIRAINSSINILNITQYK